MSRAISVVLTSEASFPIANSVAVDPKLTTASQEIQTQIAVTKSRIQRYKCTNRVIDNEKPIPELLSDYFWSRVYDCLDREGLVAPKMGFHEGPNEIVRLNGNGSVSRNMKKAIFSFLKNEAASFTIHVLDDSQPSRMEDLLMEDEVPAPSCQAYPTLEEESSTCWNQSCREALQQRDEKIRQLERALEESRKWL